jgi:c-di-GMP-binding flagellar brake protein YcgR
MEGVRRVYPKVNQNIVIKLTSRDQSWKSIVAEIGADEILIGFPMDRTILGLLQNGVSIEVSYILDEKRYMFSTKIMGRKIENMVICMLKKPKENMIKKIQMREYFRVDANLRVVLKGKESNTINISAGGLLCSYDPSIPFEHREVVSGTILVPNTTDSETTIIPFQSEIIRVELVEELERNQVGIKFIKINQQDQQKILQYCFEKQRQMRVKEREIKHLR